MRFSAIVVGASGQVSARRPVLPGNFIRLDDGERFRLYFENDWDISGVVSFVYDAAAGDDAAAAAQVHRLRLGPGDVLSPDVVFTYRRTDVGAGRLLEIEWVGENRDPFMIQYMMINNDFRGDGRTIKYGDVRESPSEEIVTGLNKDRAKDPDRHRHARPPPSSSSSSSSLLLPKPVLRSGPATELE
jgi:hypothetical protein